MKLWSYVPAATLLAVAAAAQTLDFTYYRTRVEPIFLKKRPGLTRCIVCHSTGRRAFNLVPLPPGKVWSEAESRRNFEGVSRLVDPAKPASSVLLLHPLAHEAGGDRFHSGGRQFRSQDDPDWKTIAAWVKAK